MVHDKSDVTRLGKKPQTGYHYFMTKIELLTIVGVLFMFVVSVGMPIAGVVLLVFGKTILGGIILGVWVLYLLVRGIMSKSSKQKNNTHPKKTTHK